MFPAMLIVAGVAALSVDVPLAHAMVKGQALKVLNHLLETIESFGHAFSVLLIVVGIGACDATKRWALPRMLTAAIGAGLSADILKMMVWRVRPYHFAFDGTVATTFRGILPGTTAGSEGQSFPSAHVATAVGLCVALNVMFPRGRRFFATLAALVALQRIATGAHYLSDTLWGAAVGYLFCSCLYFNSVLSRLFDRLESKLLARDASACGSVAAAKSGARTIPMRGWAPANAGSSAAAPTVAEHPRRTNKNSSCNGITYSKVSVVVPVYNERESIRGMYDALCPVLAGLACESEMIFVDDGSSDGTAEELAFLAGDTPWMRVVTLRRNCGQTTALRAGIHSASGDVVVMLDGDLQNDPADIPLLLAEIDAGADFVQGWRRHRQDRFLDRRLPSALANRLISIATRTSVHDLGCTLKAVRAPIARALPLYGELHRFMPVLAQSMGARCTEVVTRHHPRLLGVSKVGISRVPRVLLDLLVVVFLMRHSNSPMQFFGRVGFGCAGLAAISGGASVWCASTQQAGLSVQLLACSALVLLLAGLQFVSLGLLGELALRRDHLAGKGLPDVVRGVQNFGGDRADGDPARRAA